MEIQRLIDDYTRWLGSKITFASFGEYTELSIPFLDRFNDCLQIYVKQNSDGTLELTDDGYIIGNLITSGVSFKKGTSKYDTIHNIATNFGISVIDEELTTKATIKNFAQKKHLMVQAMLAIDDLYVLSSSSVKNHFIEDIAEYFDQNNILYSTNLALLGKTGNYYNYDFHLQRTKIKHERFCRGYGSLTISNRNLILFNWNDTKDSRKDKSELIVIYNDTNKVSDNVLSGFEEYGIRKIIPFSKRQEMMYLDYVA